MAGAGPPELSGFDYLGELGEGGFADVFRYRQHLGREVAVKVLRTPARTQADRDGFRNEVQRMAMLSAHPGIVTIYEVGVAPDGRPYLTMEYCPGGHLGTVAQARPLSVAKALAVGIKVAAAVEAAHRAGILHRDIKPANVLLTEYDQPALTDFGIAAGGLLDGPVGGGVSVPFTAPEVLDRSTDGDERSDVYSLAATVYAVLAGRSPFHTGVPMTDAELVGRVLRAPLPPTGRPDVPPALEQVLARALDRDPARRHETAAAFGRALQGIEVELGLAPTELRVGGPSPAAPPPSPDDDDPDRTRFRPIPRVDPDGPAAPPAAPAPPAAGAGSVAPGWSSGPAAGGPPVTGLGDRTVSRRGAAPATAPAAEGPDAPIRTSGRRLAFTAGGAVVLVVAIVFLLSRLGGGAEDGAASTTTSPGTEPLVLDRPLSRPERVEFVADDAGRRLVWSAPTAAEGDTYQVTYTDGPAELRGETVTVEEQEFPIDTERKVCLVVEAIRGGQVSETSAEVCSE